MAQQTSPVLRRKRVAVDEAMSLMVDSLPYPHYCYNSLSGLVCVLLNKLFCTPDAVAASRTTSARGVV